MRQISGLSPRDAILNIINSTPGKKRPTLQTLTTATGVSYSTVRYHVNRLDLAGLLNKPKNPQSAPRRKRKASSLWTAINSTHELAVSLHDQKSPSVCAALNLLASLCDEYCKR